MSEMRLSRGRNSTSEYDAIVIGGGPAGSTVASLLSQWGRRVLLLEKEVFPRHHIGESLLPGTVIVMRRLGVFEKVARAGFVPKHGATYVWGKSRKPWTIQFAELSDKPLGFRGNPQNSFQVDRAKFDKILLDHSRESGVTVMEGCAVTGVTRDANQVMHVDYLDREKHAQTARGLICVDASGQNCILGDKMGLRDFNESLRNIAVYSYFQGGKPLGDLVPDLNSESNGNIFVAANEIGWVWYIPLGDDRYSVGLVTQGANSREINRAGRSKYYRDSLDATPEIAHLLREARMESDSVYSQSDWSYICRKVQGPGYLLVGDAAAFVDPILSTGVHLAMDGALKAALAINTSLTDAQLTDRAMEWYEREYQKSASDYLHMAQHWYHGHRSQAAWFSQAKQLVAPESNLSVRQAFIQLSGAYSTGIQGQTDVNLSALGGFSPGQLNAMYENFETVVPANAQESQDHLEEQRVTRKSSSTFKLRNIEGSMPALGPGIRYDPYMLEEDNLLIPCIQVVKHVDGVQRMQRALGEGYLPLLQRVDGERSVQEIATELARLPKLSTQGDASELKQFITNAFNQLYEDGVLVSSSQRRPATAKRSDNVRAPAPMKGIGRNHPCPCGSGKKYKRCHGREAS